MEAADLLTDFVGRPADRCRRARSRAGRGRPGDRPLRRPAVDVAEHLIDEAVFGDHPLGRPVLGTTEHIRDTSRARAIVAFRDRRWAPTTRRRLRGRQPRARCPPTASSTSCSGASEPPEPEAYEPRPAFAPAVLVERARLQPVAPAALLPARGRRLRARRACRAGDLLDPAGRLDGLAAVRRDPRAARAAYSVYAVAHAYADVPVLQLGRAWSRPSASRPTRGCARSSTSCATTGRPRRRSRARGPMRPGAGARLREHGRRRPPRGAADDRLRRGHRPRRRDRRAGRGHLEEVREVARDVADELRSPASGRTPSPAPTDPARDASRPPRSQPSYERTWRSVKG